jgi:hypothetical protein
MVIECNLPAQGQHALGSLAGNGTLVQHPEHLWMKPTFVVVVPGFGTTRISTRVADAIQIE